MALIDLLGIPPGDSVQSVHPDPGLDSDSADELALYSLSLTSYVNAVSFLLKENDFSWKYRWNLNCAGTYGADRWLKISVSKPYMVSVSQDRKRLRFVGDVKEGLFDAIAKRLTIHKSIETIELASLGGVGPEAIKIGRLLRKRNITTVIGGNCTSACSLIFLGGSKRIVPSPYWELGFHRASRDGVAIWDGDAFYDDIRKYIDDMIGGGNDLLERSLLQDGLDFYRPARRDLCWRNIATTVEGLCEAPAVDLH